MDKLPDLSLAHATLQQLKDSLSSLDMLGATFAAALVDHAIHSLRDECDLPVEQRASVELPGRDGWEAQDEMAEWMFRRDGSGSQGE